MSKPATASVDLNWSIFLLAGANNGNFMVDTLHESVAVGWTDPAGHIHLIDGYSFGVNDNGRPVDKPAENKWLGFEKKVAAGKYVSGENYATTYYNKVLSSKQVSYEKAI